MTRAISIDDALAEAHAELGFLKWIHDLDQPGAERELELALKLTQTPPPRISIIPESLRKPAALNKPVEANRAIASTHFRFRRERLPYVLFLARRYDEAIVEYQELIDWRPTSYKHNASWAWSTNKLECSNWRFAIRNMSVCRRITLRPWRWPTLDGMPCRASTPTRGEFWRSCSRSPARLRLRV